MSEALETPVESPLPSRTSAVVAKAEPKEKWGVGSVVAERYRLEKLLGEGAMGLVFLAEHVHMRKRYALKLLHPDAVASPEIVQRFEREAIAAANITHPNIVAATDFGRLDDGSFFLVLEYVAGRDLRSHGEDGPIHPARALELTRQILGALAAAHAKGVVHRDIKPENVMLVARDDRRDIVKVLDFGIAKLDAGTLGGGDGAQLTRMGSVYGTPAYMSPEQALGQTVDARSDLYAVGLMLHEMITGRPVFDGEPILVIAMQVNDAPPPLTSPLDPSAITPQLLALVDTLVAKERDARPASANAAIELVDAALASMPGELAITAAVPILDGPQPLLAKVEARLAPMAKRLGLPARQLVMVLAGAAALFVLVMLVVVLVPSRKPDVVDTSPRRRPANEASAQASASAQPSASASSKAASSGISPISPMAVGGGAAPPAETASAAPIASGTTAAKPPANGASPIKKKGGNSLVNKLKGIFK